MARQLFLGRGRVAADLCFYPYQISLGITLRHFDGLTSIRVHFLTFKVWVGVCWPTQEAA